MKHKLQNLRLDFPTPKRILYLGTLWVVGAIAFSYPFLFPEYETFEEDPFSAYEFVEPEMPDFTEFDNVVERKKAFFNYLLPAIAHQNRTIVEKRWYLMDIENKLLEDKPLTSEEKATLDKWVDTYRVKDNSRLQPKKRRLNQVTTLLRRVDVIPAELVLMQAANESAWGTSRFATQGYNFFGLWCFKKGCGFVPKRRDTGAEHEVAKFSSLLHAVTTYYRNINRHVAYKELRDIRKELRDQNKGISAEALAQGLENYSERGEDYIEELINMIRFNRKYLSS